MPDPAPTRAKSKAREVQDRHPLLPAVRDRAVHGARLAEGWSCHRSDEVNADKTNRRRGQAHWFICTLVPGIWTGSGGDERALTSGHVLRSKWAEFAVPDTVVDGGCRQVSWERQVDGVRRQGALPARWLRILGAWTQVPSRMKWCDDDGSPILPASLRPSCGFCMPNAVATNRRCDVSVVRSRSPPVACVPF